MLQNCNQGVIWTVLPPGGSNGEATSSTLTHVLGRIHFLAALRPRIPASSWLLAGGCPKPLTTWASPARLLYFIKLAKSVSRSNLPATQSLLCNTITGGTLRHFYYILLLEASHTYRSCPPSRVNTRKQGSLGATCESVATYNKCLNAYMYE